MQFCSRIAARFMSMSTAGRGPPRCFSKACTCWVLPMKRMSAGHNTPQHEQHPLTSGVHLLDVVTPIDPSCPSRHRWCSHCTAPVSQGPKVASTCAQISKNVVHRQHWAPWHHNRHETRVARRDSECNLHVCVFIVIPCSPAAGVFNFAGRIMLSGARSVSNLHRGCYTACLLLHDPGCCALSLLR